MDEEPSQMVPQKKKFHMELTICILYTLLYSHHEYAKGDPWDDLDRHFYWPHSLLVAMGAPESSFIFSPLKVSPPLAC